MLSILFDLFLSQPNGTTKFHGGGEYIKTVYKHLIENYNEECHLYVFYSKKKYLDPWLLESFDQVYITPIPIESITEIPNIINTHHIDVFYSGLPYLYSSLNIPRHVKKIGTIHGLRTVELPIDTYTYKYYKRKACLKALWTSIFPKKKFTKNLIFYRKSIDFLDKIICVSNHTKYAIKNYYPELRCNPTVFYTPEKHIEYSNQTNSTLDIKCKYILLISCNRWEKNAYRALLALENLFKKKLLENYKIVTIGKIHPKVSAIIQNKDNYIFFDYVSTEQLENLYKFCDLFLYPTLNEGFGMPPLEAMKYGKTCIVSSTCSLPEVCGNAAYYCNPFDINEIQNRIIMATEKKINEETIISHLKKINEKQKLDLDKLCRFIISENTNTYE